MQATTTAPAPLTKLIKSSIYVVGGIVTRHTGEVRNGEYVFSSHGTETVAPLASVERATKDQYLAYLGKA